jgi:hypothetical protein
MNKNKLVALSALGLLSLGSLSAEAKVLSHFNGNGAFADAFQGGKEDGYAYLNVGQGGTSQSMYTYLNYYSASCDWSTGICQGVAANGQIPNQDFNAQSKNATLSTNPVNGPDFSAVKWTYDMNSGTYSESPITLGPISVSWKANGVNTYKAVGNTMNTYLNISWKSVGQSTSASASVTGSIAGAALDSFGGDIGTNSNNDILIERN